MPYKRAEEERERYRRLLGRFIGRSRPNTLPSPGITGLLGDYLSTLDKINRIGNTGLLDTPSDFTSPISWDHPYMSSEDATYSQALKSQMADDMFGTIGQVGYGVAQPVQEAIRNVLSLQFAPSDDPSDYRSQAVSGYPTGVPGTLAQIATGWANVQPGVRELVDDLIEKNVLGITTPDVTPTTFDSTPTGNPHKDKPVDLSDWLNENIPPLKPAPEVPEYEPPLPPREEWARAWEGTAYSDRYPGDFDGYVKPLISGIGAKKPDSYTGNPLPDYSKLRSPYPAALNLYARGKGIWKYVGEPGYENLKDLVRPDPGDSYSWGIKQYADLDAQLEEEYQQGLIDQQASYDEMVAEMVETERLRQKEYAAERQRYTDMYFDLDNALAYDPYKVSKKELPASITPSMEQMLEWNPFQFDTNFNTNIPNPALSPEERQLDPDAANKALDAMGYGPLS